ncbi:RrF2 family transcriptional regulator [Peptoniphilus catoniae]|uniref:RrF2 family transcriptional regulator n=1 Tax=Peptoniphilus catoniae TaxID=1660341 RepID=UPI0010FE969D|nr:Rrf2 family transcriptional regulator [Peptoniphilus catoniae]
MKISTRGRYGLMAMYSVFQNYGKGPISINEIAEKEHLSVAYLEQLFALLKKAGLVKSIRGAFGGYELTRDPSNIKIKEILNALEDDIALSCSVMSNKPECRNLEECATKDILDKLQIKIDAVLDSLTLADM